MRVICAVVAAAVLAFLDAGLAQNAQQGTVARIGNEVSPSSSGVDVEGAIFLLNDVVLSEGVVFAFSAFFRTDSKVRFQIWRPIVIQGDLNGNNSGTAQSTSKVLSLVAELGVTPSVVYSREDVYFESKLTEKCIRVKQGDRVGVYLEENPGSVSFVFDSTDPQSLSHTLTNTSRPYQHGEQVQFDPLTFPYDFSVAAYVDTNLAPYENETGDRVECPRGLMIPEYADNTLAPTTRAPITGSPGATGATGPRGGMGGTGPRGGAGPAGGEGEHGYTGATGPMGSVGATGNLGSAGATGAQGPMGATGAQGGPGEKGDQGQQGERGVPGAAATLPPDWRQNGLGTDGSGLTAASSSMDAFADPLVVLICIIWLIVVTILLIVLLIVICMVKSRQKRNEDADLHRVAVDGGHIGGVVVDPIPTDDYPYANIKDGAGDAHSYQSMKGSNGDLNGDVNGDLNRGRLLSTKSGKSEGDPEWISDMNVISSSTYSLDTITRDGKTIRHKDGSPYVNRGAQLDDEAKASSTAGSTEALNTTADPENISLGNISRD